MYWVYLQIWGGGGLQKVKTWQRGGRGKGGQVPARGGSGVPGKWPWKRGWCQSFPCERTWNAELDRSNHASGCPMPVLTPSFPLPHLAPIGNEKIERGAQAKVSWRPTVQPGRKARVA